MLFRANYRWLNKLSWSRRSKHLLRKLLKACSFIKTLSKKTMLLWIQKKRSLLMKKFKKSLSVELTSVERLWAQKMRRV